jgi:exonuclease SbcC
MEILLLSLYLRNFKGVRDKKIEFDPEHQTNIFGDNATGKTTLFDAFLWNLFGKNSNDQKDFGLKTFDENNEPFHHLEHEVSATLEIDGVIIDLRKVYYEKWVAKKGSATKEFKGHETAYYWNDVPMKQEDYTAKVSGLLNESIFKLITSTTYFNQLKWQDRRAVLLQIAGKIENVDVLDKIATIKNKTEIFQLTNALNQGKSIDEFKKEISAKKKKIKDELDFIPSMIAEATRALPEEKDFSVVETSIKTVKDDIDNIDGMLSNKSKAYNEHQQSITQKINERQVIIGKMQQLEFSIKNDVQGSAQTRLSAINSERAAFKEKQEQVSIARREYTSAANTKTELSNEAGGLRTKWETINNEELKFNAGEFCCPACKRDFEAADIDAKKTELTNNFNKSKSDRLSAITERGTVITKEIADIDIKLDNLKAKGETLNAEIKIIEERIVQLEEQHSRLTDNEAQEITNAIASHSEYNAFKKQAEDLTQQINDPYTAEDNSALMNRKKELQAQLETLTKELSEKELRTKQLARIAELQSQESSMAQELASFEGVEFTIDQFNQAKMDTLEQRINGRFQIVKFKMYEDQINGGKAEACTTLINGVPYSDANTAAKIQAGLDIINTLSEHYDVKAPVWVDNRESVVKLPETKCQLINLIVSEKDKKIRVESGAVTNRIAELAVS